MRSLFCLILLSCIFVDYSLTISDTDYIQCTSQCSPFNVTFSEPFSFPSDCQENNDVTSNYDYALACGIEYRIDYNAERIYIEFQASNDTGTLEDQKQADFLIQTTQLGLSQTNHYSTAITVKYGCNTQTDCARKFYLNSINRLVTEGASLTQSIKSKLHNDSLLMGYGSKRRCIDSNKTGPKPSIKCPNGLCYLKLESYGSNEQQNSKFQSCGLNKQPTLLSVIEHHTPRSANNEREILEFSCNKNVCNRNDIIDKIKILIDGYTNQPSQMQDNQSITEKQGNLSIKQTATSSCLVLILCLIQLFI